MPGGEKPRQAEFESKKEKKISESDYKILQTRLNEAITFLKKSEIVQTLAEYELLKKDHGNKPVKLTSAISKKSFQVIRLLKKFGAEKINDDLLEINVSKDPEFVEFLSTKVPNINYLIPPKIALDPFSISEVGLGASIDKLSRLNVLISRFLETKEPPKTIISTKKKNIKP